MFYIDTEFMNETQSPLAQPLTYRVWDPKYRSFFYTDVAPDATPLLDRWTGLFDKQGLPIYENDIIRVHYNWKLGWVRAQVVRDAKRHEYIAQATLSDGEVLRIGFYCFADSYRIGNMREHAGKLTTATEQFQAHEREPWWLSSSIFRSVPGSCFN
jgi:hypothetical protein